MPFLGELLVEAQLVSKEQLREALRSQAIYGGHIGTNLVELGYINDSALQQFLSRHHGVAALGENETPSAEALECIAPEVCERLNVLPLRIEGPDLVVALVDQTDFGLLGQLEQIAQRPVRPVVANEGRLYGLMRQVLGIERPLRYAFVEEDARRASRGETGKLSLRSIYRDNAFVDTAATGFDDMEGLEEILLVDVVEDPGLFALECIDLDDDETAQPPPAEPDELEFAVEDSALRFAPARTSSTVATALEVHSSLPSQQQPLSFERAVLAIQQSTDRDQLATALLRHFICYFRRALIFSVQHGLVLGWNGMGERIDNALAQKLIIPLNVPSIFQQVHETRAPYRGGLLESGVSTMFVQLLGGQWPTSCYLLPLLVGERVVSILYADGTITEPSKEPTGNFTLLCNEARLAFRRFLEQLEQRPPQQVSE